MKRTAIILCILAMAGCKENRSQSDDSVLGTPIMQDMGAGFKGRDIPDSLYLSHHWNDRGYLFGKPSDIQLSEWKSQCEEASDGTYEKWEIELFQSNDHLIAVKDLLNLVIQKEELPTGYEKLILWRLSDYMPPEQVPDNELSKFKMLEEQIDTLISYDASSQFDCNCQSELALCCEETVTKTLYKRLLNLVDDDLSAKLEAEDAAYCRYHEVQTKCFDIVKMAPVFVGSAAPIAYNGISQDDVMLRRKSLEAFYFYLADGRTVRGKLERHSEIPLSIIENEYDAFISELPLDDNVEEDPRLAWHHPLADRKRILAEERDAFLEWMAERDSISESLSGSRKRFYCQATNNARRHKLMMLKNRYEGYGIGTEDYFNSLLSSDCTDEQLMEFHIPKNI